MFNDNDDDNVCFFTEHGSLGLTRILSNKNIENSLVSVCCASLNVLFPPVVMNKFLRYDELNPLPYGETKKKH